MSTCSRECECEAETTEIRRTTSVITTTNRWDHALARWGVRRMAHCVDPGLYALGSPGPESPVLVSANYTLSFDVLRSSLDGLDCYILVLDTKGINVWCAAGKGTFGTDELVRRVEAAGLAGVVGHRELIVPQLGATGVAAHEVRRRTGFGVTYGPVRASDIQSFLESRQVTEEMRTVDFPLKDRVVLIPVELVYVLLPMAVAGVALYFLGGALAAWSAVASVLAGTVLFPVFLPSLPTPNYSTKGLMLGVLVALPFAVASAASGGAAWWRYGWAIVFLVGMPQVTAFLALNFTGATPFTSKSGVKREIFSYFPFMAWMFGASAVMAVALAGVRLFLGR